MKIAMLSMWYVEHTIMLANGFARQNEVQLYIDNNSCYQSYKHAISSRIAVYEIHKPRGDVRQRILYYRKLFEKIRQGKPDVFMIQDGSIFLFGPLWKCNDFYKVAEIHDPIPHLGEKKFMKMLNAFLMARCCDNILVHSKKDVAIFRRMYAVSSKKVRYSSLGMHDIYLGYGCGSCPGHTYNISAGGGQPKVLFFGRISKYKGIAYFIRASEAVKRHCPDANFIIAGQGSSLAAILKKEKYARNMTVINEYIDNEALADLFRSCSVVVLPYISATQSGVLFTAMAFRKPVVATDVGGIPEIVRDTNCGVIVKKKDPASLAKAICFLLDHTQEWKGRNFENYTYPHVANQITAYFKQEVSLKNV